MGVTLRSDVDASAYAQKAVTAVSRGLLGMWFFDSSLAKIKNDFGISSNASASVVGNPSVMPGGTQFHVAANYLRTDVREPDDLTFCIVLRALYSNAEMSVDPNKRIFACGNYGASMAGLAIGYGSPTTGRISFGRVLTDGSAPGMQSVPLGPNDDPMAWRLVTGTFSTTTGVLTVRDETAGVVGTRGGPGFMPAKDAGRAISIGNESGSSAQKGPVQISQLRLYSTALNRVDEIPAIVAEMRRYELTHNGRAV